MVFRLLLALVVFYALWRGSRDERQVALICLAGAVLTTAVLAPVAQRFASVETPAMVVDLIVFIGFLAVALRSQRFWPLWVAGLQLTTILGHFLKAIESDLLPRAYGAALNFWAYPIVLILAIGTWRNHQRHMRGDAPQAA